MRHRKIDCSALTTEELIELCANSADPEAWQEFVRRFHKPIAGAIVSVAYQWGERSNSVIEDLVQDTYLKICANERRLLKQFKSRHPDAFYGMLKVTAGNVARDYFRANYDTDKRGAGVAIAGLEEVQDFVPDGHAKGAEQIELEVLFQQIDQVLLGCSDRDRQIFWLHYQQGLTAEEIAAIPSFCPGTKRVESVLHRLRLLLREALDAEASEADSEGEGNSGQNSFTKGEGHR